MELKRCPNIRSVQYCDCKDGECSVTKLFEEKRKAENKTAVEWLVEQVAGRGLDCGSGIRMKIQVPKDIAEQAKQMEKDQIVKAYLEGDRNGFTRYKLGGEEQSTSEQYYQETYGKKEEDNNKKDNELIPRIIRI